MMMMMMMMMMMNGMYVFLDISMYELIISFYRHIDYNILIIIIHTYNLQLCMSLSTYHYFSAHRTITPSFPSIFLCTISYSTVKRLSI